MATSGVARVAKNSCVASSAKRRHMWQHIVGNAPPKIAHQQITANNGGDISSGKSTRDQAQRAYRDST